MRNKIIFCPFHLLFLVFTILSAISTVNGQEIENRFQARTSTELSKKLTRNLKFALTPELRWAEGFELDKYLLNSELQYKLFDFMSVSASYRFIGNKRPETNTEFLNRYQFKTILKTDLKRWEPGFRLSYTNYADDNEGKEFLRYKFFLSYDIKKSKFTPEAGFEIFHQLDAKTIYKLRYRIGLEYKLSQRMNLGFNYKLDYYLTKYRNRHILDIGLKMKF